MIEIKSHNTEYHIDTLTMAAKLSSEVKKYKKSVSQIVYTNKGTVLLKDRRGQYITSLSLETVLKEYNQLMSEV